jgi:lactoylglutathione lyase
MFVHTSIRSSNLNRSIEFYKKYFGLIVINKMQIESLNRDVVFLSDPKSEGAILELTLFYKQEKFLQASYEERLFDHLGFEVVDIKKVLDEMRKDNVKVTSEPIKLGEKAPTIAFIEDPDGTLIELIQRI